MANSFLARMAMSYRNFQVALLRGKTRCRSIGHGLVMEINPHDPMDRAFYLGNYDRWLVRAIFRWVRKGDIVIDVGAHKGYVTLLLAKAVGPTGHVFAFEPDPRARTILARNCKKNALQNVSIYDYALGHKDTEARFALSSQLGWSSMFPNEEAQATTTEVISVRTRSVDELVENREISFPASRLSFVKIDAEGAEPLILSGMERTLRKSNPVVWMEVNPSSLLEAGAEADGVLNFLRKEGFTIHRINRLRKLIFFPVLRLEALPADIEQSTEIADIVALRPRNTE